MNALPPSAVAPAVNAGWGVGVAILLLQGMNALLPAGEGRDWAYYACLAVWAAAWLALTAWARFTRVRLPEMKTLKRLLACYAAGALSWYFLPPLLRPLTIWVWPLAVAVGFGIQESGFRKRLLSPYTWAASWFVAVALGMAATLLMRATWFGLVAGGDMRTYALPYVLSLGLICPVAYIALTHRYQDRTHVSRLPRWVVLWLHILAAYLLLVPLFRTYGLNFPVSIHHWKAFVEPAEAVREGGWLLWDTPSQYGFLQTLLVAMMPVANVWQAFYLVNAALLSLSGMLLFAALFAKRRTLPGWAASMLIALSCAAQLLPFIDSRMMPSTGAVRFLFVYLMAGYVFLLARRLARDKTLPKTAAGGGHLLWLLGALWSFESAIFVSVMWFPALLCIASAQAMLREASLPRAIGREFGRLFALAAVNIAGIGAIYYAAIGHLPDWSLYTVYATSYTGGFNAYPIERIGIMGCWLMVFALTLALAREYIARAAATPANLLSLAALVCALAGLWAMASAFVPISDDVHLVGTLPVLVYLAALASLLLPQLSLPHVLEAAYSKALVCLYVVIALGTLNCFKPGLYDAYDAPVERDVTRLLPTPPDFMQALVRKAGVEKGGRVMVLAEPFSLEEGAYFRDEAFRPWLLPNTEVAYDKPLSPQVMQLLAMRRAARMEKGPAWVIERQEKVLAQYPWIAAAAKGAYDETGTVDYLSEYRIRRFEKR